MEPIIHTKDIKLTSKLRNYVNKKVERLDRYMPDVAEVRMDLSTQKSRSTADRQIAQITLRDVRGTILRAEERNSDILVAIDHVMDKIYRQISRYRGKRLRRRKAVPLNDVVLEPLPFNIEAADEDAPPIIRSKQFAMLPMSAEEAVDQMELLGHAFYMFYNADAGAVNLVYRRDGGGVGLLQPVVH